jgi:hypothetical protein
MATAFDSPVLPFADPFAALETQIEASTRAINASAELYTQVLNTQAAATRAILEAYSGLGAQAAQAVQIGSQRTAQAAGRAAETTERAVETTERAAETAARTTRTAARETSRATKRTTRRAASTTRRAAKPAARAAAPAARAAAPAPRAATPAPTASTAPISGYDDLTAEQIVAKLPEQPQTVLAKIATYEQAKDKRATVLQRIAALTGPEPAPGYDALTADEAQKLVTNGSATLAAAVRDYERRHKDRASVIETAVRHADADTDAS